MRLDSLLLSVFVLIKCLDCLLLLLFALVVVSFMLMCRCRAVNSFSCAVIIMCVVYRRRISK